MTARTGVDCGSVLATLVYVGAGPEEQALIAETLRTSEYLSVTPVSPHVAEVTITPPTDAERGGDT